MHQLNGNIDLFIFLLVYWSFFIYLGIKIKELYSLHIYDAHFDSGYESVNSEEIYISLVFDYTSAVKKELYYDSFIWYLFFLMCKFLTLFILNEINCRYLFHFKLIRYCNIIKTWLKELRILYKYLFTDFITNFEKIC